MIAAACGGAAVVALSFGGIGDTDVTQTNADPSTTVAPTPSSPDDDCCATVQPQSGTWDCKIGLNCGQIRPRQSSPANRPPNPPDSPPQ